MAYIEKRLSTTGKCTYRARVRVNGMPDISASFSTRTAAKEWALRTELECKQSRHFAYEEGKKRTFDSFINDYIDRYLPKNPKAYKKQKQILLWWHSKLKSYYLSHISPIMIAGLRDELTLEITYRGSLRSTSTVNRYLASLSKAFSICVKELGWLQDNPVLGITRLKEAKGRERFLSKEEIGRLLEACKASRSPYLYPIVLFALSTGARKGEILHLKWGNIDIMRGIAVFRETKNGETRSVVLSHRLIYCLKKEMHKREIKSSYIFPSKNGLKPADIEGAWDHAIQRADLPDIRFHDLRHTSASHLAMSGASTLEIAAILGHKTLAMVKRYSHLSTSSTIGALTRMENSMFED